MEDGVVCQHRSVFGNSAQELPYSGPSGPALQINLGESVMLSTLSFQMIQESIETESETDKRC